MQKVISATIFTLFLCLITSAAVPTNIAFKHLGMTEGFFQTNVASLYQDENGAVWIASNNGVFRYNGNLPEEHITGSEERGILPRYQIRSIMGEHDGVIYFCQEPNIIAYDLRKESFNKLFADSLTKQNPISVMCVRNGVVMAATRRNILRSEGNIASIYVELPEIGEVTAMMQDQGGNLYLGTMSKGLLRVDKSGQFEQMVQTNTKIISMIEDSNGEIWATTRSEGIFVVSPNGKVKQFRHNPKDHNSLIDNYVRCICEDDEGLIWIGTMYGLDCFDPSSGVFHHFGKSDEPTYALRNLTVECIMKDLQGSIWLGSYYTGISYFNTKQPEFETIPIISDNTTWTVIADIAVDKHNTIWAGTSDKGLYSYDSGSKKARFYNTENSKISSNNIKCIQYDHKRDGLWIGTFMGGALFFDIPQGRFTQINISAAENNSSENMEIVHRIKLHADKVYLATYAGVYTLDVKSSKMTKIVDDYRIFDIMIDRNSNLFTVPLNNRLWIYSLEAEREPKLWYSTTIPHNTINSLYEDSQGRVWIASTRDGILLFDREQQSLTSYNQENCGVESNNVSAITEISGGKLLVGNQNGVSVINPDNFSSINYNHHNGFPLISMQNGCIYRAPQGRILMGGVNGIVSCHESVFDTDGHPPKIRFQKITVNNIPVVAGDKTGILKEAMPYTKEISLNYKQTHFSVEFCSDDFLNFNPATYRYKLEDYDDSWQELTQSNTIGYMNLPPGSYNLCVKSKQSPSDGSDSPVVCLAIHVSPPYYASLLAYIVYVLLIIGITSLIIRYFYSKKMLKESLRFERKDKEQKERVTQWKFAFFTNISHEFRTPLTLILGQLDLIMRSPIITSEFQKLLGGVKSNAQRMKLLVDELIDFRKQEQGYLKLRVRESNIVTLLDEICSSFRDYSVSKGIELNYSPESDHIKAYYDTNQLQKVFYNLLSNAFRHTDAGGRIDIGVGVEREELRVKITDTGHGIDKSLFETIFQRYAHYDRDDSDAGMGIGLSFAKAIVELHQGSITVDSELGVGSTFTVILPMGLEHFKVRDNVEIVEKTESVQKFILPRYIPSHSSADTAREVKHSDTSILIVEDDEELRSMLVTIFSPIYNIIEARDGKEGFEKARQLQPNLIVSDVMMPVMTGYELCEKIKTEFETCHIPVVLLTALSTAEQNIEGLNVGADDYIMKPFDIDILLASCASILKNRSLLHKKFISDPIVSTKSVATNQMDEDFINKILRLIVDNIANEKLDVTFLCREMLLSRTALFAKTKGISGQTPNDIITSVRLSRAATLIKRHPELSITEIAEQTGFNSIQYFGKAFKNRYNISPSEYRKTGGSGDM